MSLALPQKAKLSRFDRFLLRWKAKILLFLGQRARAREVFLETLALAPDDVLALNSLGYDALQTGHPALALPYFEQVLRLTPSASNAHFNVAFVCESLNRLDEAESAFRSAIAIEEKMDRAWYGLGLVYIRQKRFDDAVIALKRNTQLQPMSPYAWYQLGRTYVEMKQPDEAKAVIAHLKGFEPKIAAQLARETGL